MYHPLPRSFLYTAFRISVDWSDFGNSKKTAGTGFIVIDGAGRKFLVTNRHVVDPGFADPRRSHLNLASIRLGGFISDSYLPFGADIDVIGMKYARSDLEDVAIVEFSKLRHDLPAVKVQNIPRLMFASDADLSELMLAETVYFPGYPAWNNSGDGRPIMRRGTIASDPMHDYGGGSLNINGRVIAYEGFSFSGSSGSPIFLPPFGVTLDGRSGGNFRPPKLLGVNAGHLTSNDTYKSHTGISYFYRSTVVDEILSDFSAS